MPTRSRVRKPVATATPEDFFPDEVAGVGTVVNPQSPPVDEEDDGTIDTKPIEEGEGFYDTQSDPELLPDEDDDPSAGTALGRTETGATQGQQAAQAELKDYLRRFENLLIEKDAINTDIGELKKEMAGKGYDLPAVNLVVKLERMTETQKRKRREQNGINATYAHAAGIDEDLL